MMLNKNLRNILYYVVSLSLLCLMIEFTKRIPDPRTSLSPKYYEVVTAKHSELATLPKDLENEKAEDIIPKRNRGRLPDLEPDQGETVKDEKTKFREWKVKQNIKSDEKGLFKRWKKEMRIGGSGSSSGGGDYISISEVKQQQAESLRNLSEVIDENKENEREDVEEEEEDEEVKPEKSEGYDDDLSVDENMIDTDDLIDYPGGVTKYFPPADSSCSDFRMTDSFKERKNHVRNSCQKLGVKQKILYSRMRWAVPERLLYCPVFKAASTSWLLNYFKMSNSSSNPKEGNLHTKITNLFPPPATFKLRKQIYSESVKFIIVRHPFERLVSAYRDKLAGYTRNEHYLQMRKVIIKNYRRNKSDKSSIPTFKESVDFVLDELKKMESGSSNIIIDGHFMPYTRRCIPCAIDYDVIIKFETIEEDSQYLIEQCHLDNKLKVIHENAAPTGARTDQGQKNKSKKVKAGKSLPDKSASSSAQSLKFYQDIDSAKLQQLYDHYLLDFEIFGYSAEEYLH